MDCSTAMKPSYCSTTPTNQKVSRFLIASSAASLSVFVFRTYSWEFTKDVGEGQIPRIIGETKSAVETTNRRVSVMLRHHDVVWRYS